MTDFSKNYSDENAIKPIDPIVEAVKKYIVASHESVSFSFEDCKTIAEVFNKAAEALNA